MLRERVADGLPGSIRPNEDVAIGAHTGIVVEAPHWNDGDLALIVELRHLRSAPGAKHRLEVLRLRNLVRDEELFPTRVADTAALGHEGCHVHRRARLATPRTVARPAEDRLLRHDVGDAVAETASARPESWRIGGLARRLNGRIEAGRVGVEAREIVVYRRPRRLRRDEDVRRGANRGIVVEGTCRHAHAAVPRNAVGDGRAAT